MVAEKAGVTAGCVSLCLNDHPLAGRLSRETKERIYKAAETLHYTPSPLGRALKTGKSRMLGLVIPRISNSYFSFLAEHILEEAAKNNYRTLIINAASGRISGKELLPVEDFLDGIISCIPLEEKLPKNIPVTYIECNCSGKGSTVRHDISRSMKETALLMKAKGHKKVWGLFDTATEKSGTFYEIFKKYDLEPVLLPYQTSTREERKKTVQTLLKEKYPALVINGHLTASLFFRHLEKKGSGKNKNHETFSMPDVAVICGYWNGELLHDSLLCVTVTNLPLAAEKAVKLLLKEIKEGAPEKKTLFAESAFYSGEKLNNIAFTDPEREY